MNDNELKLLWQSSQLQLQNSLRLNQEHAESITRLKVNSLLSSVKPAKIFLLILGVLWVAFLGNFAVKQFITAYQSFSPFFLYSLALQIILTAVAIVFYMYQLELIRKVDFSQPILGIQRKLTRLQLSTLQVNRILFLQFPLWTTFYLHEGLFTMGNSLFLILQAIFTVSFTGMAIWLFFNIRYENRNKKWFRILFNNDWEPVFKSMELLDQMEQQRD